MDKNIRRTGISREYRLRKKMLKLRYSATSPYVRKVMMTLHEAGLTDRVEIVLTDAWSPTTDLGRDNPLGKVPALVLEDGTTLVDSRVICEYLDSLHPGTPLFPPAGPARWAVLRQLALGDGLCDVAVSRLLEGRRPEGERSPGWIARQKAHSERTFDRLEQEAASLDDHGLTIGTLALLAALAYVDLRFADDRWREGRPALAAWFERNSQRPSFQATRPPAP